MEKHAFFRLFLYTLLWVSISTTDYYNQLDAMGKLAISLLVNKSVYYLVQVL